MASQGARFAQSYYLLRIDKLSCKNFADDEWKEGIEQMQSKSFALDLAGSTDA